MAAITDIPYKTGEWRVLLDYLSTLTNPYWPTRQMPGYKQSQSQWDAWNGWPLITAGFAKPTWAELVILYRKAKLDQYAGEYRSLLDGTLEYRNAHLPETITERSAEVDLLTGTALLARRVSNDEAGSAHDLIALDENNDGTITYFRTPQQLERELNLARNEQLRLKSAIAIVHGSLRADRLLVLDESKTLLQREAAQARLVAATAQDVYEGSIRTALASLSTAPTGLQDSKEWHINRLERDGAARKRYVTGADSRQGDWLDHSCSQQRDALDAINGHVQRGRLDIRRSDTTTKVSRAYSAASLQIDGVAVVGSAEWSEPPSTAVLGASVNKVLDNIDSGRNLQPLGTYRCGNPSGSTGAVAIEGVVTSEARVESSIRYDGDNGFVTLQLTGTTVPDDAFQVHLHGRNACGPKQLTLRFAPPASS